MSDTTANEARISALVAGLEDLAGRAEALSWEGRTFSGRELDRLAARYARWLVDTVAPAPGDRVAVLSETHPLTVATLVAHLRLGLVHVPVPPRYTPGEVDHIVADSGALRLISPLELEGSLGDAVEGPAPVEWPSPPDDVALAWIVYTSGTTGRPKGVMVTHRALAQNLGAVTGLWRIDASDRVIAALPLFHVHGLGLTVLGSLLCSATIVLISKFSAARVVAEIGAGATVFMGVPTMYHLLLEHLDAAPDDAAIMRRARLFTAGSAALPPEVFERFAALTGHAVLERYGMTETGFTLSNPYEGERRPGTVGGPVPGVELRLVDEDGQPVADGVAGEIEVRGAGLMLGYWGRPEASAEAFREGWFRTGDTGIREGGYVRIVGRTSTDIIKTGGFKVGAREIEDVLMASGLLRECAVLGSADPKWGEVVLAVVVAREARADRAALAESLARHCERHLADYKRPRRFEWAEALPRNALGKVQKAALRKGNP